MTIASSPEEEAILEVARQEFAFLEAEGGRREESRDGTLLYHIDYVFEKITLELSFDWREGWVDLYVCRTADGKPPPGWAYHEGRVVRIGLPEVLSRGEAADRPPPPSSSKRCER